MTEPAKTHMRKLDLRLFADLREKLPDDYKTRLTAILAMAGVAWKTPSFTGGDGEYRLAIDNAKGPWYGKCECSGFKTGKVTPMGKPVCKHIVAALIMDPRFNWAAAIAQMNEPAGRVSKPESAEEVPDDEVPADEQGDADDSAFIPETTHSKAHHRSEDPPPTEEADTGQTTTPPEVVDNLRIWTSINRPPAAALKKITGGRLKNKTDINPQWRLKMMTGRFGPIGTGWNYEVVREWTEPGPEGELMCFVDILLRIKIKGEWLGAIPGSGGSMLVEMEKGGLHANDEAYKMATTDALSVAMKQLGMAADIYQGLWDGSKYK